VPAAADTTAPQLAVAVKLNTVRRNGKLAVNVTLSEQANLKLTATARKNAGARLRTVVNTTRSAAAGKSTITLKVKRTALHKGEKVTFTVQARDAAGNVTTRTGMARVA
jgi:hypothetical protein